jgi:hypothetical protein
MYCTFHFRPEENGQEKKIISHMAIMKGRLLERSLLMHTAPLIFNMPMANADVPSSYPK